MKTVNIGNKWFQPKVQTVGSIHDFLAPSPESPDLAGESMLSQLVAATSLTGVLTSVLFSTEPVFAASAITNRIISAFNPIVDIIQGLAYPVGFIMITAGALVVMTGNRQKGMQMIKWAAIGYLLMMFCPGIMTILVEVGKAVGK